MFNCLYINDFNELTKYWWLLSSSFFDPLLDFKRSLIYFQLTFYVFIELNKHKNSYQNKLIVRIKVKLKDNKKSKLDLLSIKTNKKFCSSVVEIYFFLSKQSLQTITRKRTQSKHMKSRGEERKKKEKFKRATSKTINFLFPQVQSLAYRQSNWQWNRNAFLSRLSTST